jgi:hypothetical protein
MSTPEPKPNSGRKLFYGLFVFPLIIVVGMIVMVCSVILLTNEQETPEALVAAIKKAPERKRWQKASELSNELNRKKPEGLRSEALMAEIDHILGDAAHYDSKTRAYMAMAMSRFGDAAVPALRRSLHDKDAEVQFFSLWALGMVRAREAIPDVAAFLKNDSPELRANAAYVLGAIGDTSQTPALRALLEDTTIDARWNAALALARLGDDSGWPILVSMLKREDLAARGMDEAAIERVMMNAIKGLALIRRPESVKILESVARSEQSLRVRQMAMEAVKQHRES